MLVQIHIINFLHVDAHIAGPSPRWTSNLAVFTRSTRFGYGIFNLGHTLIYLRRALSFFKKLILKKRRMLLVSSVYNEFRPLGRFQHFFYANHWIGGLLTNFKQITTFSSFYTSKKNAYLCVVETIASGIIHQFTGLNHGFFRKRNIFSAKSLRNKLLHRKLKVLNFALNKSHEKNIVIKHITIKYQRRYKEKSKNIRISGSNLYNHNLSIYNILKKKHKMRTQHSAAFIPRILIYGIANSFYEYFNCNFINIAFFWQYRLFYSGKIRVDRNLYQSTLKSLMASTLSNFFYPVNFKISKVTRKLAKNQLELDIIDYKVPLKKFKPKLFNKTIRLKLRLYLKFTAKLYRILFRYFSLKRKVPSVVVILDLKEANIWAMNEARRLSIPSIGIASGDDGIDGVPYLVPSGVTLRKQAVFYYCLFIQYLLKSKKKINKQTLLWRNR